MHPSDFFGHDVKARQFPAQKVVMRFHDVLNQLMQRQLGGIVGWSGLINLFGFQLFDNGRDRDIFAFASLAQGAGTLAAKVDLEALKNTGTPRPLGDQFANRPFGERSSRS